MHWVSTPNEYYTVKWGAIQYATVQCIAEQCTMCTAVHFSEVYCSAEQCMFFVVQYSVMCSCVTKHPVTTHHLPRKQVTGGNYFEGMSDPDPGNGNGRIANIGMQ